MIPDLRAIRRLTAALCACVGLLASGAHAASFDCAKKLNQIETLICEDGELSQQDELLASSYVGALKQRDAAQRDSLRRDERQWLAHRNAACALSDIDNEASRIAVKRCVLSDTGRRIEMLKTGTAPSPPEPRPGDEYRRGADDVLQLVPQPDGKATVAIMAGNARGVCDVELEGRRVAAGRYLFTDADTGCSVSVDLAGNSATVDSSGACSSFCGAHAPGFTGAYLRKPGQRAASKN